MNVLVPSEKLFSIQRAVNSNNLTIRGLRSLEDQVLNTEVVTSEVGLSILSQIDSSREELLKKEVTHLRKGSVSSRVESVQMVSSFLTPGELEEEIDSLKNQASTSKEKSQVERLEFQSKYPIAMELEEEAPHSTFASRMLAIESLELLSDVQKKEVLSFGEGVKGAEKYVRNLQLQLDAAIDFHFDRIEEGEAKLEPLSDPVRRRIDGLVWQGNTMTDAILISLEERIIS